MDVSRVFEKELAFRCPQGPNSAAARTRASVTHCLGVQLYELLGEFQALRMRVQAEYRYRGAPRCTNRTHVLGGSQRGDHKHSMALCCSAIVTAITRDNALPGHKSGAGPDQPMSCAPTPGRCELGWHGEVLARY